MRKLLLGVLMLSLTSGCKKTMENLEKDTQIQASDNQKPMANLVGGGAKTKPPVNNGTGGTMVQSGSGGAVQNVRNAVRRTVSLNEFNNLKLFIETASLASGSMPTPQIIVQSIGNDLPNLTAAIQEGTVVLTGIRQREGVWAYEKSAIENNGLVLTNNGVERISAAQLKQMLMGQ